MGALYGSFNHTRSGSFFQAYLAANSSCGTGGPPVLLLLQFGPRRKKKPQAGRLHHGLLFHFNLALWQRGLQVLHTLGRDLRALQLNSGELLQLFQVLQAGVGDWCTDQVEFA